MTPGQRVYWYEENYANKEKLRDHARTLLVSCRERHPLERVRSPNASWCNRCAAELEAMEKEHPNNRVYATVFAVAYQQEQHGYVVSANGYYSQRELVKPGWKAMVVLEDGTFREKKIDNNLFADVDRTPIEMPVKVPGGNRD